MSKTYFILSLLMAATVGLHVFGGGPEYADPFKEVMPNADLKAMSLVLWHAVTVVLIAVSIAYMWLAYRPSRALYAFTTGFQLAWAALFLFYGATILGEFSTQPQWVLFTAFPLIATFAEFSRPSSRRDNSTAFLV